MGCCVARCEELTQSPQRTSNPQVQADSPLGQRTNSRFSECSPKETLEEEWDIVTASILPDELVQLKALEKAVEDLDSHPACSQNPLNRQPQTLLRFLRGRVGNVSAAATMFRDSMNWRTSFGVDERIEDWRQELEECSTNRAKLFKAYGTDAEICIDKVGVPVWLMRLSVSDPAGMLREVGKDILLVNSLLKIEAMHAHLRRAMFQSGKVVRGCIQVVDVGDYRGVPRWWNRMVDGYKVGKEAFKIFDLNYPETTRKIFILRSGSFTTNIYKWVSPLVPPRTKDKMKIFGADATEWGTELRAELSEGAQLPGFLTCNSAEAFASARPAGGIVPVEGHVSEEQLKIALRSESNLLEMMRNHEADEFRDWRHCCLQETSGNLRWHRTRLIPSVPIILVAVAAALSGARALSYMEFGLPGVA